MNESIIRHLASMKTDQANLIVTQMSLENTGNISERILMELRRVSSGLVIFGINKNEVPFILSLLAANNYKNKTILDPFSSLTDSYLIDLAKEFDLEIKGL